MKKWIWTVSLVLLVTLPAVAQTDVAQAQAEALRLYPELGVAGSRFNKRFVKRVTALKAGEDPMMQRTDWPLVIAKQVAAEIGLDPVGKTPVPVEKKEPFQPGTTLLDKEGSTSLKRPATGHEADNPLAVVPGRKTISGTVFQRTADGLLVSIRGERIWLSGFDAKQGQKISVPAVKSGTHSYIEVSGAERLVDAYEALK